MSKIPLSTNNFVSQHLFQLPYFEGPIQLLLHLIEKKSLNITEINLSLITDEFTHYTQTYKDLGHTQIAEFLEIATHLLYLKSCFIIPFNEENSELEQESLDYREKLIQRLIAYDKLKHTIEFLASREQGFLRIRKQNTLLESIKGKYHIKEYSIADLMAFYENAFISKNTETLDFQQGQVSLKSTTVEDQIAWWKNLLAKSKVLQFFFYIKKLTTNDQITSFLSLLELSKQSKIKLEQEKSFGDIIIYSLL